MIEVFPFLDIPSWVMALVLSVTAILMVGMYILGHNLTSVPIALCLAWMSAAYGLSAVHIISDATLGNLIDAGLLSLCITLLSGAGVFTYLHFKERHELRGR